MRSDRDDDDDNVNSDSRGGEAPSASNAAIAVAQRTSLLDSVGSTNTADDDGGENVFRRKRTAGELQETSDDRCSTGWGLEGGGGRSSGRGVDGAEQEEKEEATDGVLPPLQLLPPVQSFANRARSMSYSGSVGLLDILKPFYQSLKFW